MNNRKIIFTNIIICLLVYLLFEIFSGDFIKKRNVNLNHKYLIINQQIERKVNLYTKEFITISYYRDKFGFKDRFKKINEVDVITVGGSTTEQKYLSIENTWTDILEKKINQNSIDKIDIVNSGISGQSSKGHIWNLKKWFNKIDGLKPSYIIYYMGINESQEDNSKSDPQPFQIYENLTLKDKIKNFIKVNNGITYKLYRAITQKNNPTNKVWHDTKRFYHSYKKINDQSKKYNELTFKRLEKRLEEINILTKELNSIPIFVTQTSLRWKKKGETIYSIDDENYYYNEMNISKTIMQFCKKNEIKCIDGFNKLKFIKTDDIYSETNDTFDLLHTTPSGSKKIADMIYNEIYHLFTK